MIRSRGERDEPNEIDELARALPPFRPDDDRAERVRTETLARVAEIASAAPARRHPGRTAAWTALPLAAAAGLVWFIATRRDDRSGEQEIPVASEAPPAPALPAPPRVREVRPRPGAVFEKAVAGPTETVTLDEGSIEVEVGGLAAGESLRVVTRDAEIVAEGATFEAEARGDRLVALVVREGRVVMQASAERTRRIIAAGESWTAPAPAEGELPAAGGIDRQPPRPAGRREPKRSISTAPDQPAGRPQAAPGEVEFQTGWAELRAGKPREAAGSFAAARRAAGEGGLGEDAHFWQGISLARSGQRARATEVLREFVRAHPRSSRAGEASAKLGWLLYDTGKLDEAERWFEAAAADRVPQVKKSAQGGLEAIARRRKGGSR